MTSENLDLEAIEANHRAGWGISHEKLGALVAEVRRLRGELARALDSMHHCNNEAIKAREEIARLRESRHDMERRRDAEAWAFDTEVGVSAALRKERDKLRAEVDDLTAKVARMVVRAGGRGDAV